MTWSRCGAGTVSTPLSRSRARSLPSRNPGNAAPFPILPTYLGKPGRGGKSYRNRWQRTDRSPQVTNLLACDRCRSISPRTFSCTLLAPSPSHLFYIDFIFCFVVVFSCALYLSNSPSYCVHFTLFLNSPQHHHSNLTGHLTEGKKSIPTLGRVK
jgi:hypothetical protein